METSALVASADACSLIEKQVDGKVHSVFNNSLNLQFGDRLVHVGSVDEGLAPFSIGIEPWELNHLLKKIYSGQPVRFNTNQFIFQEARLWMHQVQVTDHTMPAYSYERENVTNNIDHLISSLFEERGQLGFTEINKEAILHDMLQSSSSDMVDPMLKKLHELEAMAFENKYTDPDTMFNFWIGRGQGLTPSGDDLLVGTCAAMDALGYSNAIFLEQLKSYLQEKGHNRTTNIGYEYLWYAAEKKYHSHVINMCKSLIKESKFECLAAVHEMKKIGYTSGMDTLIGMLLGAKRVKG
ncbi:DUF2877 domain-containing protein [Salicibibacter cibarius]|uniref:DUF2877 domain-containing protein n=2 Tax=Salicibibacter cibarius TaxID=2743000 RepID=A0A7T7CCR0_9BACI|nr:DUF2877 domain-containing protein [Salicibibacter cibarius]